MSDNLLEFRTPCLKIFFQKVCIVAAVICHKKAGDDACAHLQCIKRTGLCLKRAGVGIKDLPPNVVSWLACATAGNCVVGNADSSFTGFTELSIPKGLSPPVERQTDRLRKKECGKS